MGKSKYLSMILANGYSKSAKQKNNEKSVEHYYSLHRFFKQSGSTNQTVLPLLLSIAYLSSLQNRILPSLKKENNLKIGLKFLK